MIENKDLKKLFRETSKIVKHHKELTVARGDHFNLFSVLNIETKENRTHSAFLAMLLNPKGDHMLGTVFLDLFLSVVKHNDKFELVDNRAFDTNQAFVIVEKGVGLIDLKKKKGQDPSTATGGRIDIYIEDKNFNIISIENKIHAIDQPAQIQRYCNHKTSMNTVYFLTLQGKEPHKKSKLKLESGTHFYNISYKNEILEWLNLCLKEVSNFTGLRESINQYILLIKKLTNTLNNTAEMELFQSMAENMEEAKYVAENYQKLITRIREDFRKEVVKRLILELPADKYWIESKLPINQNYSKICIHYLNLKHIPFSYFVEPFSASGNADGAMFVGLYGYNNAICKTISNPNRFNDVWQHIQWIVTGDGNKLHLNSPNLLRKLYYKNPNDSDKFKDYDALVNATVTQTIEFIKATEPYLFEEFSEKN
jgi:hypothetical protein